MSELKPCPFTDSEVARKLRTFKGICQTPGLDDLIIWAADIIDRCQEPNEPLTLEQLREMDGEPVWVDGKDYGGWTIFKAGANKQVARCLDNVNLSYYMADYGKTWVAYRRKPESDLPTHANTSGVRPKCFYSDTASEFCLGMAHGDDDYPVRECEKCWYLDANEDLRQTKEREQNE